MSKVMSAENLVLCLAGEHLTDPALMVETIKDNPEFWAIVRQYGKGQATYEQVLETSKSFI